MLNTFHLRTFLAVVDMGSYSAAAQSLHLSQPAVSQQIRTLEEQLGDVRLFRRVGQRMVPTHAGEVLATNAREVLVLATRAEEAVMGLRGQVVGRVTLGCTANSGEVIMPALLSGFRSQFPAVMLSLEVAPFEILLDDLGEREVLLVLSEEQQRRRGWESHLLGSEPLMLLAPAGHSLLALEQVPPGVLREQLMILPRPGNPLRRTIEEGLRRRSVALPDLQVTLETDSTVATMAAIRDGLGLAFVPRSCLPPRSDSLGIVDMAGQPMQQLWHLLRLRERNMPRAAQELYDFLLGPAAQAILGRLGLSVATDGAAVKRDTGCVSPTAEARTQGAGFKRSSASHGL
ncbi:LysR family transcriptional regulator [Candidatus Gracilibacteria bacterium]|nr:LysR family transcriptional regulator [Candidatus Gracilibacteria bacterium]